MLLNHRTVSLAPKQTQVLRRRHGETDAPKAQPPPLRCAGCSPPGLQNQGGDTLLKGWSEDISPPHRQTNTCSEVSGLLNCSEEPGQFNRLPEVPGNGTLLFWPAVIKAAPCMLVTCWEVVPGCVWGVSLHALCLPRYSLPYSFRSLTRALISACPEGVQCLYAWLVM